MIPLRTNLVAAALALAAIGLTACPGKSDRMDDPRTPDAASAESPSGGADTTAGDADRDGSEAANEQSDVVVVPGEAGPHAFEQPGELQIPEQRRQPGVLMLPNQPPPSFNLGVGGLEPPKLRPLQVPPPPADSPPRDTQR